MTPDTQLDLNFDPPKQPVENKSSVAAPAAPITESNIVSFESAVTEYRKIREAELLRKVTSWNQQPKSM